MCRFQTRKDLRERVNEVRPTDPRLTQRPGGGLDPMSDLPLLTWTVVAALVLGSRRAFGAASAGPSPEQIAPIY